MNDSFDRAPGAGRTRNLPADPGLAESAAGDCDTKTTLFNQREPLRQPRTSPPFAESNISTANVVGGGDFKRQSKPQQSTNANSTSAFPGCNEVDSLVKSSKLSASAPEFVPSGINPYEDPSFYDDDDSYYGEPTLADTVTDFLAHLSSSPGSFESDVEHITGMLNSWVTTEELLKELVELIYTQSTAIPNFSYTGARLCNYLSHHLIVSPPSGNYRQLLLQRCRKEYEQRDVAVQGDPETQKKFHSFVLFLGELYLNLELTGSVLDDAWKESGKPHMEELIQRIETILLDATCSRDVRQMLLKLVELRSSDWGRVRAAAAASNATPDNDPNYFMNEPTFYTEDGTPFTAADPEYAEKYQEILDRQDYFHDLDGENGNEIYDSEDEMEPEIEEAFENFCLEAERKRQQ
ncbi:polyadenylate-binding protein-interacting protein 1 isoform X3 [Sander vitreus]